jgi:hypothetical protein
MSKQTLPIHTLGDGKTKILNWITEIVCFWFVNLSDFSYLVSYCHEIERNKKVLND